MIEMKCIWLSVIGLAAGALVGQVMGSSFTVIMLVGAGTVAVIELVSVWRHVYGN